MGTEELIKQRIAYYVEVAGVDVKTPERRPSILGIQESLNTRWDNSKDWNSTTAHECDLHSSPL